MHLSSAPPPETTAVNVRKCLKDAKKKAKIGSWIVLIKAVEIKFMV